MSKDCIPNIYKDKIEEIIRNVYETGYDDGINDGNINNGTFNAKIEEVYYNGLYDAWEAARKIVYPIEYGGLTPGQLSKIFGTAPTYDILKRFSATEAIENIKEYESHLPDKDVGEIKGLFLLKE